MLGAIGREGSGGDRHHGRRRRAGLTVVAGKGAEPLERQLVEQVRRDQVEFEDRLPQVAIVFLAVDLGGPNLFGGEQALLQQDGDQGFLSRGETLEQGLPGTGNSGGSIDGEEPPGGGKDGAGDVSTVQTSSGCAPAAGSQSGEPTSVIRLLIERLHSRKGGIRPKLRVLFRNFTSVARTFFASYRVFPRDQIQTAGTANPERIPHAGRFTSMVVVSLSLEPLESVRF